MADLIDIVDKNIDKIKKLEKKLDEAFKSLGNVDVENIERIEKLEESDIGSYAILERIKILERKLLKIEEVHEENFHMSKGELIDYRKIQKELSDLKKEVGAYRSYQNNCSYSNELKERVEGIFKSIHGIAPDDVDNIKDTLRELLSHVENHCETKKLTDNWERQMNASKLLEKLDSGENAVVVNRAPIPSPTPTDSKPEPICVYLNEEGLCWITQGKPKCQGCKYNDNPSEQELSVQSVRDGKYYPLHKPARQTEWTGDWYKDYKISQLEEFRKLFYESHIVVEKEDLIKWMKEFQKIGHPCWEEFEKYGIDTD